MSSSRLNHSSTQGLEIDHVSFAYEGQPTLADITLTLPVGEFVSLLGPSGCGKSTLLKLLAGLLSPAQGQLSWQGRKIDGPSLERGVVFQDYSLFPWMTLEENLSLALAKAHPETERKWRRQLTAEYLELVGLADASGKYPFELSGGMQQRGAIARALAVGSPVLLMDEPFGALDPINRTRLQDLLLSVWSSTSPKKTVIFVTHDVDEALYLSDRIVMLGASPGRVIAELDVPFARPRQRRALVNSAEFQQLRRQIDERFQQDVLSRIEETSLVGAEAEGI
ncbi:MAG TPA: ABC transporter ATP-binding protein [Opitutaceae bacterium]|nr:ABC transporter ATP-binding protein [Opitutaceae bacterium]HPG17968.1 ABC transporter ATP-binding protein [Opitutaceae bacterium]HPO00955.1 ABC transporter ATP-binding protein [Opitutaceae bacterium]